MTRLLLGILDKATLRLGDNATVNFERCLIFMTSNLGGKAIQRAHTPDFGFEAMVGGALPVETHSKVQSIGLAAMKRKFTPEFVNRIDSVVTYQPLNRAACDVILDHILASFAKLVTSRLGIRAFRMQCTLAGRALLLDEGTSMEYGARELKRTIQRRFIQPVAALVSQGRIRPGSTVILDAKDGEFQIIVRP